MQSLDFEPNDTSNLRTAGRLDPPGLMVLKLLAGIEFRNQ